MPPSFEPGLKQQQVGQHVRRLREQARLSVRALAARTGFSPSFISQLENGQVSPSIHSMEKIAGVLGVTLGSFFAAIGPGQGGLVMRKADRQKLPSNWSNAELESLGLPSSQRRQPHQLADFRQRQADFFLHKTDLPVLVEEPERISEQASNQQRPDRF